jgi:hypothetical protein
MVWVILLIKTSSGFSLGLGPLESFGVRFEQTPYSGLLGTRL